MTALDYHDAALPVSEAVGAAHNAALATLAKPGAWWSGADRLAIAAATRDAPACGRCREDPMSLSENGPVREHGGAGALPPAAVDAIHGIRNHSGRLTRGWFDRLIDMGLPVEAYVELVAIVASTVIVDTYALGLGHPPPALPTAVPGQPSLERSSAVADAGAWLPLAAEGRAHILRSLGLVPSASALFFSTFEPCYYMRAGRAFAIAEPQVELVASRVSAVNECFY